MPALVPALINNCEKLTLLAVLLLTGCAASVNRGEAMLVCNDGASIQVEFFTGSGTANGYGVAK